MAALALAKLGLHDPLRELPRVHEPREAGAAVREVGTAELAYLLGPRVGTTKQMPQSFGVFAEVRGFPLPDRRSKRRPGTIIPLYCGGMRALCAKFAQLLGGEKIPKLTTQPITVLHRTMIQLLSCAVHRRVMYWGVIITPYRAPRLGG